MNNANREEIIQFVHQATSFGNTLSGTSMTTLEDMAVKYGNQQKRLDDVNRWFQKLKKKDFDGTKADTEWLNEWLSELP
jgi:hypothetical protein